uniref:Uncharacterized protein n=1 Tax=Timema douglasi TaxID=61478 RepID=A0A7R8VRS7_TIMDO|nr:unnamed protein product [Timema douglasi]
MISGLTLGGARQALRWSVGASAVRCCSSWRFGITGHVRIDENGDRDADYSVLDLDPITGRFEVVAHYKGLGRKYIPVAGKRIHWPGGRDGPPPDIPQCGFMGNDLTCNSHENMVQLNGGVTLRNNRETRCQKGCKAQGTPPGPEGPYDNNNNRVMVFTVPEVYYIVMYGSLSFFLFLALSLAIACIAYKRMQVVADLNNMSWRVRPEEVLLEVGRPFSSKLGLQRNENRAVALDATNDSPLQGMYRRKDYLSNANLANRALARNTCEPKAPGLPTSKCPNDGGRTDDPVRIIERAPTPITAPELEDGSDISSFNNAV